MSRNFIQAFSWNEAKLVCCTLIQVVKSHVFAWIKNLTQKSSCGRRAEWSTCASPLWTHYLAVVLSLFTAIAPGLFTLIWRAVCEVAGEQNVVRVWASEAPQRELFHRRPDESIKLGRGQSCVCVRCLQNTRSAASITNSLEHGCCVL
jgi:hypothetical protein